MDKIRVPDKTRERLFEKRFSSERKLVKKYFPTSLKQFDDDKNIIKGWFILGLMEAETYIYKEMKKEELEWDEE